jgi:hypothetical protein
MQPISIEYHEIQLYKSWVFMSSNGKNWKEL